MASIYTINYTDPNKGYFLIPLVDVDEGPTGHTSLRLVGRGRVEWGEGIHENFLHLLENFSSPEDSGNSGNPDPLYVKPPWTRGQLWHSSTDGNLYIYREEGSPENAWVPLLSSSSNLALDITIVDANSLITTVDPPADSPQGPGYTRTYAMALDTSALTDAGGIRILTGDTSDDQYALGLFSRGAGGSPEDTLLFRVRATTGNTYVGGNLQLNSQALGPDQDNTLPTYSFGTDPDTGMYLSTVNELSFATDGELRLTVESDGTVSVADGSPNYATQVVDDNDVPNKKYVDDTANSILSAFAGVVLPFAGSTAPAGFLLCDGSSYSIAQYPRLFSIIGYTYGTVGSPAGSPSEFRVPDLRGKTVAGVDSATFAALGTLVGEETHTLTTAEMPSHAHTGSTSAVGNHNHKNGSYDRLLRSNNQDTALSLGGGPSGRPNLAGSAIIQAAGAHAHSMSLDDTGGDVAHNNIQPTISLNYIIGT